MQRAVSQNSDCQEAVSPTKENDKMGLSPFLLKSASASFLWLSFSLFLIYTSCVIGFIIFPACVCLLKYLWRMSITKRNNVVAGGDTAATPLLFQAGSKVKLMYKCKGCFEHLENMCLFPFSL